jgi:3-(3-hydroxy-phenyl)propionate hydroxylase
VEIRFGHRMERFTEVRDGVDVDLIDADGEPRTVRAGYLVGADGGRSVTRKSLGLPFEGATEPTRWLMVDLRNDPLGTPNAYMGCDPSRPYVSIGLPHGIRRFEFMLFPHEDEAFAADDTNLHALLAPLIPDPVVAQTRLRISSAPWLTNVSGIHGSPRSMTRSTLIAATSTHTSGWQRS